LGKGRARLDYGWSCIRLEAEGCIMIGTGGKVTLGARIHYVRTGARLCWWRGYVRLEAEVC
jgi:hypothetical protein